MKRAVAVAILLASLHSVFAPSAAGGSTAQQISSGDLIGLWKAERRFGPAARGPLVIEKASDGWTADFLGRIYPVRVDKTNLSFVLPGGAGSFSGQLQPGNRAITGHWTLPNSTVHGFKYAVPVVLNADGSDRWRGTVIPRDDNCTLYLMFRKLPDDTIGAFLHNPDRNIGLACDITHVACDGNAVNLMGRAAGARSEVVLLHGAYDPDARILSIALPDRGGTYDFKRDDDPDSGFYPRGRVPGRYTYRQPMAGNDGWPTGTIQEAKLDRAGLESFIQTIVEMPMESVHTPEVEAVLIARHGKLVVEEYFHGFSRDTLHETRSAAKSITATVVGAAIQAGAPLRLSSPVYQVMNGGTFPPGLEPRKQAMTLEHLLMMRGGYYCNDSDPAAPGNEETMLDQTNEPDYYKYTLNVPMAFAPDEESVYCSSNPNLALGIAARATGESPLDLFDRLIAGPLNIQKYAWPLDPVGHPYGGGSVQMLPRDFLKIGQLMLNGGTWRGRRVLGREFVARASAPLHDLNGIQYGYLWWSINYPYKDRVVRAYFAGGNGGQGVMVVPELDLVIGIFAGNYADQVGLHVQQDLVPNYILPAVREAGDAPNAPVVQRNFYTPYAHPPLSALAPAKE